MTAKLNEEVITHLYRINRLHFQNFFVMCCLMPPQ